MSIVTHRLLISVLLQGFFNVHASIDISGMNTERAKTGAQKIRVVDGGGDTYLLAERLFNNSNYNEGDQKLCVHALVFENGMSLCGRSSCKISYMKKFYTEHFENSSLLSEHQLQDFLNGIVTQSKPKHILEDATNYHPSIVVLAESTIPSYLDYISITSKYTSAISIGTYVKEYNGDNGAGKITGILTLFVYGNNLSQQFDRANLLHKDGVRIIVNKFRSPKYVPWITDVRDKLSLDAEPFLDFRAYLALIYSLVSTFYQTPYHSRSSGLRKVGSSYFTYVTVPTQGAKPPIEAALELVFKSSSTTGGLKLTPAEISSGVDQELSIADALLLSTTKNLNYDAFTFHFAMETTLVVFETNLELSTTDHSWGAANFYRFIQDVTGLRETHRKSMGYLDYRTQQFEKESKAVGDKVKLLKSSAGSGVVNGMFFTWYKVERATNYQNYAPPQCTIGKKLLSIYNQVKECGAFSNQEEILSNNGIKVFPEIEQPNEPSLLSKESWVRTSHNKANIRSGRENEMAPAFLSDKISFVDLAQLLNNETSRLYLSVDGSDGKHDVFIIMSVIYEKDYLRLYFDAVNLVLTLQKKPELLPSLNSETNFSVEGILDTQNLPAPGKFITTSTTGKFGQESCTLVKCLSKVPASIGEDALIDFGFTIALLLYAHQKHVDN